jgi:hypothetical protein
MGDTEEKTLNNESKQASHAELAEPNPTTMEYIKKILNETAARNGLKFKKVDMQTQLIYS